MSTPALQAHLSKSQQYHTNIPTHASLAPSATICLFCTYPFRSYPRVSSQLTGLIRISLDLAKWNESRSASRTPFPLWKDMEGYFAWNIQKTPAPGSGNKADAIALLASEWTCCFLRWTFWSYDFRKFKTAVFQLLKANCVLEATHILGPSE